MSLVELATMQRVLAQDAIDPSLSAKERALCATAWQRLESQRLDTSGCPRPGQFRPEMPSARKQRNTVSIYSEPAQIIDAVSKQDIQPPDKPASTQ